MDIAVQYQLSGPFFISTRLMPAIRVGLTKIHMRAHSVDTEDGDTRVRWEYLIDGPSVHYAAADVTTPYLGQEAIAGQLPTAMGTLLAGLGHLADGDEAGPFPHDVYAWAGRHQDDLTIALNDFDDPPAREMTAVPLWRAITHDLYQTPYGRWCAAQAVAHADRFATLHPSADHQPTTGLAVRDEAWHESALAWYTMLTNRPEPEPPTTVVCTVADRDTIETWLRQSAPRLADDLGHAPRALHALVEQAQQAGLFGIRDHTIRGHTVIDDATGSEATLLTIHPPSRVALAAGPFAADLLTGGVTGPGDAVSALRACATAITNALATNPEPGGPDRGRPFPPLGTGLATAPSGPLPDTSTEAPHRHR